jgi:hypothetical protein
MDRPIYRNLAVAVGLGNHLPRTGNLRQRDRSVVERIERNLPATPQLADMLHPEILPICLKTLEHGARLVMALAALVFLAQCF